MAETFAAGSAEQILLTNASCFSNDTPGFGKFREPVWEPGKMGLRQRKKSFLARQIDLEASKRE
jgi:hypothetical protein